MARVGQTKMMRKFFGGLYLTAASRTLFYKGHGFFLMKKNVEQWKARWTKVLESGHEWQIAAQMSTVIDKVVTEFLNAKPPLSDPILTDFLLDLIPQLPYLTGDNSKLLFNRIQPLLRTYDDDETSRSDIEKGTLIWGMGMLARKFFREDGPATPKYLSALDTISTHARKLPSPMGQAMAGRGLIAALPSSPFPKENFPTYGARLNEVTAFIHDIGNPVQRAQLALPLSYQLNNLDGNPDEASTLFHSVAEFASITEPVEKAQKVKHEVCDSLTTRLDKLSTPHDFKKGFDRVVELASGITDPEYRAREILNLAASGIGGEQRLEVKVGNIPFAFWPENHQRLSDDDRVDAFNSLVGLAKGITTLDVRVHVANELQNVISALPTVQARTNARALLQTLQQP